MKKLIILSILLIGALIVSAKSVEQEINYLDSYEVPGHNITLIGIGDEKKSVVICVNNERHIMDRKQEVEIEDIKIEPITIYDLSAKLKIIYSNEEAICDESCSNSICMGREDTINENENVENNNEETGDVESNNEETITEETTSNVYPISIGLMVLVIILLLIFFGKKKR